MAFYGAVRPLHANRQIGNTFDIEPQDIYLYMNELASLVALEKLTLLEFQKLGTFKALPFSSPRHAWKASRRRSREVIYYCQNGLPEVMTGDFISAGPVSRFVCMRRAFFLSFPFFLIGTPSGDRHDISVHSPAHLSAVRARSQEARKSSSFDHIHLSRKWKVRPSEQKRRKVCSMS